MERLLPLWEHWIIEKSIEMNTWDIREDKVDRVTGVKIAFQMSHNYMTAAEEQIQ
jgi:hypothetical protein